MSRLTNQLTVVVGGLRGPAGEVTTDLAQLEANVEALSEAAGTSAANAALALEQTEELVSDVNGRTDANIATQSFHTLDDTAPDSVVVDVNNRIITDSEGAGDGGLAELRDEVEDARGSLPALDDRLAVRLDDKGRSADTIFHRPYLLTEWILRMMQALLLEGICSIAWIGDSWRNFEGTAGFIRRLVQLLQAVLGNGGPGWVTFGQIWTGSVWQWQAFPANNDINTVTYTGTWTGNGTGEAQFQGHGPDLGCAKSTVADSAITVPLPTVSPLTAIKLAHLVQPNGGTLGYCFLTGGVEGSYTNINTAGALAAGITDIPIPSGVSQFRVKVITPGTAGVELYGGSFTRATGFVGHRLAMSGSHTGHWSADDAIRDAILNALNPTVIDVGLGTNDRGNSNTIPPATFGVNLGKMVDRYRVGRARCDVVLTAIPENDNAGAYTMGQYREALLDVAYAKDCAVKDIWLAWRRGNSALYNPGNRLQLINGGTDVHPHAPEGYRSIVAIERAFYLHGVR